MLRWRADPNWSRHRRSQGTPSRPHAALSDRVNCRKNRNRKGLGSPAQRDGQFGTSRGRGGCGAHRRSRPARVVRWGNMAYDRRRAIDKQQSALRSKGGTMILRKLVVGLVALAAPFQFAAASIITYEFEGTFYASNLPDIAVGTPFAGTFSYDTNALVLTSGPNYIDYL